jgi:hypothetical protein
VEPGVLRVSISEEYDAGMLGLSLLYAKQYAKNGINFINCFLKFPSIRSACAAIVWSAKHDGSFKEAEATGKDFSNYTEKLKLDPKWKPVLADTLLILYSIIQPDSAKDVDKKETQETSTR